MYIKLHYAARLHQPEQADTLALEAFKTLISRKMASKTHPVQRCITKVGTLAELKGANVVLICHRTEGFAQAPVT